MINSDLCGPASGRADPGTIDCFYFSGCQFGDDLFVTSFLVDVGGADSLVALTLGVLFTVTRTLFLETKITAL